jgi:hypothetical protein
MRSHNVPSYMTESECAVGSMGLSDVPETFTCYTRKRFSLHMAPHDYFDRCSPFLLAVLLIFSWLQNSRVRSQANDDG